MSDAIKRLHDYLAKSPSMIYPQDALEYLPAIEAENAKLRELVLSAAKCITDAPDCDSCALGEQVSGVWVCHIIGAAKELGVEVD